MSETHDTEFDSRQKLEADVRSWFWHQDWCQVDTVLDWLDRQAALTASVYNKLVRRRRQENEKEFARLERDRYEWQRRWQLEDEAHYHQRKATVEMIEELWHALQNSVELPKDADGEYIRIGSHVERDFGKCHVLAVSKDSIVVDVSMSDGYEDGECPIAMYLASSFHRCASRGKECGEDAIIATNENMSERGWMRLPKDADGVPIHVGDVMDFLGHMTVNAIDGRNVFFFAANWDDGVYCESAASLHHYHEPAVEDVLEELMAEFADGELTPRELAEKYADRLRLKVGE